MKGIRFFTFMFSLTLMSLLQGSKATFKQPCGPRLCQEQCKTLVGCKSYNFVPLNLSCCTSDSFARVGNSKRLFSANVTKERMHRGSTCSKESRIIITRLNGENCIEGSSIAGSFRKFYSRIKSRTVDNYTLPKEGIEGSSIAGSFRKFYSRERMHRGSTCSKESRIIITRLNGENCIEDIKLNHNLALKEKNVDRQFYINFFSVKRFMVYYPKRKKISQIFHLKQKATYINHFSPTSVIISTYSSVFIYDLITSEEVCVAEGTYTIDMTDGEIEGVVYGLGKMKHKYKYCLWRIELSNQARGLKKITCRFPISGNIFMCPKTSKIYFFSSIVVVVDLNGKIKKKISKTFPTSKLAFDTDTGTLYFAKREDLRKVHISQFFKESKVHIVSGLPGKNKSYHRMVWIPKMLFFIFREPGDSSRYWLYGGTIGDSLTMYPVQSFPLDFLLS